MKMPVKVAVKNAAIRVKGIKNVFTEHRKSNQWGILKLKKLTETKDQLEAKQQKNCIFCGEPITSEKL